MNFSFFITKDNGSGICRGRQISEKIPGSRVFLKENINREFLDKTICIWVKYVKGDGDLLKGIDLGKNFFIDIIDGTKGVRFARKNPEVGIIASSKSSHEYISKKLNRKDVILIPHHHCNFENETIPDRPIRNVGFVGHDTLNVFDHGLKELFMDIGLQFNSLIAPTTRESVVSFLLSIDIQIAATFGISPEKRLLKNSLKLSNGGSFKIPSVATPEISYVTDYDECFVKANDIESIVRSCKLLKDDRSLYRSISEKSFEKSKNYHIEEVVKLYEQTKSI